MIILILVILIIIVMYYFYKKPKKNEKNYNYAIPDTYSKPLEIENNSTIHNNEEPYYMYADADNHHESYVEDNQEFHFDDFEE